MVLSHQISGQTRTGDRAHTASQPWRSYKYRYRHFQALCDGLVIGTITLLTLIRTNEHHHLLPPVASWDALVGPLALVVASALVGVTLLGVWHAYDTRRMGVGFSQFRSIFHASAIWLVLALIYLAFTSAAGMHRPILGAWAVAVVGVLISHLGVRSYLRIQRQRGQQVRRALVVSTAGDAARIVKGMDDPLVTGSQVVQVWLDAEPEHELEGYSWQHADLDHIDRAVDELKIDVVVVSAAAVDAQQLRQIGWKVEHLDVELVVAPPVEDVADTRLALNQVAGTPLLAMDLGQSRVQQLAISVFDRVVSGLALILLAPFFAVIAVIILIDSGAPVFYRQIRVGHYGQEFSMVKFRTMHVDADARLAELAENHDGNEVLFKLKDDPRVTRTGKFLRRFSLDELPQLWNVFLGQMSLVGPRPPLPREAELYDDAARQRLRVKPGITGLWQVSGRSDLSWDESVRLDIYYADNVSFRLNLKILLRTVWAVVGGRGAY